MNFQSDNTAGAAPEILAALARVNDGVTGNYGDDHVTARLTEKLCKLFEKEIAVFPVGTGTAANSLTLATLTPHYGAILCHDGAHIHEDECGAPEFFSGGAKLVPIAGPHGKLTPASIEAALSHFPRGDVHRVKPAAISLTQATECGTTYAVAEVAAVAAVAKKHGLALHMDGARLANAVAHLKCTPAEITWKAGVDALSFGLTKNGAISAEAAIFFDPARVADFEYRRKRGGHLFSKMRFPSAQIEAMIDDGLWLKLAGHANAMAARLGRGVADVPGFALEHAVEANEVFVRLPSKAVMSALFKAGAKFYPWGPPADRPLTRFVCAFNTKESEVDEFLAAAQRLA
jgi:threonine aldolase